MRADPEFRDKPAVRDAALAQLRADILVAPVDVAFQTLLKTKLDTDFAGQTMRFRSSTNAEDLDGFVRTDRSTACLLWRTTNAPEADVRTVWHHERPP